MTIEEVTKLRKQEKEKTLRKPLSFKEPISIKEKQFFKEYRVVVSQICSLLEKKGVMQNFSFNSLISRRIIKNSKVVNSFKGLGTEKKPYVLDAKFGKFKFWNAHECFKKESYPEFIEENHCFANCYTLACCLAGEKIHSKVLSGIFYNCDYSILHSVIEFNNYICDFNLNICMEKDLYIKLFPFEVLSELEGERIFQDREYIHKNLDLFKKKSIMYLNFAYDDCLNYINDKQRQQQNIEFID